MRLFSLIFGSVAALSVIAPAEGALITFSDLRKDAALGVHVQPTGPQDVPQVVGLSEVYGSAAAFLTSSPTERFYSGVATFDQPATEITFDVSRINNSGWRNPITIIGLEDHKRVAVATVNLKPLGDTTRVTIDAPAIDQVEWKGTDWVFHPYAVRDVQITFQTAAVESPRGSPSSPSGAGSALPEPQTCVLFAILGAGTLLRRRRKDPFIACA